MWLEWLQLILVAIGLAMDAFAVAICNGIRIKNIKLWQGIVIALTFGIFQGLMPTIGYFLGETFMSYIEDYDHWVAFALLDGIGLWMIFEGIKDIIKKEEEKEIKFNIWTILFQGVVTSIDAFAVGITLTGYEIFIAWDALVIFGITFVIGFIGVILGKQINKLLKGKYSIANIIGGSILVILGIYIVIEHTLGL